jgi:hypothetical protein
MPTAEEYRKYKTEGRCVCCCKHKDTSGTLCKPCAEKNKKYQKPEYHRNRYAKRKAARLCVHCGKPSETEFVGCRACREHLRTRTSRSLEERQKAHWRYFYELSPEQYNNLLTSQGGKCAICRGPLTRLHIDHNHATKKVRGILCHNCNVGIGNLRDDPVVVTQALEYLIRTSANATL